MKCQGAWGGPCKKEGVEEWNRRWLCLECANAEIDEEQIQIDYDDWKTLTNDVRDTKNQIRLLESKTKYLSSPENI